MNSRITTHEPRFEEIAAYFRGELEDPERVDAVLDALAGDPELARAALDMEDPSGLEAHAAVDVDELDAAWSRFLARQNRAPVRNPPMTPSEEGMEVQYQLEGCPSPGKPHLFPIRSSLLAWAASLLVATGFSLLLYSNLKDPPVSGRLVVERLERDGEGGPRRGAAVPIEAGPGVDSILLLLAPPSTLAGDLPGKVHFVLKGEEVLRRGELPYQDEGYYALLLAVSATPPGEYTLELLRPGEAVAFSAYRFVLESENRW